MELVKKIEEYRRLNKLSQQNIADKIGIPRGRYQQWENGNARPKYAIAR